MTHRPAGTGAAGPDQEARASRAAAAERLGRLLYYHLERLDPSYKERAWDDLPGGEQDVYIGAVRDAILFGEEHVLLLLSDDGAVSGRT